MDESDIKLRIETAIEAFARGEIVVVTDDDDRENEGDLTIAAEKITPEAINFMAAYGRGLICVAMTGERLDDLKLSPMVPDNTALGGTAFTVSDRLAMIGRGRIILEGSKEDFRASRNPQVRDFIEGHAPETEDVASLLATS